MRLSLLLLVLLAPALAADEEPVLLVKNAACFVHAIAAWPALPDRGARFERVVAGGHALLHTSRETGKMVRLVEATGTVAVNTRRISFLVTRLVGVAADADRLYVVLWRSGRIFDRPPEEDAPADGGTYELRVFWLADGSALRAPVLGPDGLPEAAPPESLGKGPLHVVAGGVDCFGKKVRYDARELREP